jgi:hypothetical protein
MSGDSLPNSQNAAQAKKWLVSHCKLGLASLHGGFVQWRETEATNTGVAKLTGDISPAESRCRIHLIRQDAIVVRDELQPFEELVSDCRFCRPHGNHA